MRHWQRTRFGTSRPTPAFSISVDDRGASLSHTFLLGGAMTQLRLGLLARSQLVMSGVALSLTAVSCFTTMAPSRAQSVLPQITGEFVGSGCPKGDLGCVPTVTSAK